MTTGRMSASTASRVPAVPELRWITVWARAVITPAWRRMIATWFGCMVVGGLVFGPTAMRPSELTRLALHDPGLGGVLAATWGLLFVPVARLLVRPQVAFLASLPGDPRAAWGLGALALIGLQLPWLLLWTIGEGVLGLAIVLAMTVAIAAVARWQPPRGRPRFPAWGGAGRALCAIHVRALRRRAGDALVRGAGLAVLAGLAGGLFVRNNHVDGAPAAALAASVIAVMIVPAQLGAGLIAYTTDRELTWLVASTGIPRATRIAALVAAVAGIHVLAAVIASAATNAIAGGNGWLFAVSVATAIGTALGEVRAMLVHASSPTVATRIALGAVVAAAAAVVCLSVLGAIGALATIALGLFALWMVKP
jgi:hypothetical protein